MVCAGTHQDKVSTPKMCLRSAGSGIPVLGLCRRSWETWAHPAGKRQLGGDLNFGCPRSHQAPCPSPCWAGSSWRNCLEKTGMVQGHEAIPKSSCSTDTRKEEGSASTGGTGNFPILLVGCPCSSSHSSPGVSQSFSQPVAFCSSPRDPPGRCCPWAGSFPLDHRLY